MPRGQPKHSKRRRKQTKGGISGRKSGRAGAAWAHWIADFEDVMDWDSLIILDFGHYDRLWEDISWDSAMLKYFVGL